MRFMNEYDVAYAADRFDPSVTPRRVVAAEALARLVEWTNANSDGWPYWSKPARSAAKLMALLEGDGTWSTLQRLFTEDCTAAELNAAFRPIKAFLSRHGVPYDAVFPQ